MIEGGCSSSVRRKKVESQREPERDEHVGNQNAGKEVRPYRYGERNRSPETGALSQGPLAERVGRQQQPQLGENQRQSCRPVLHAEDFIAGCHAPVQQRSLFQITHAVDIQRGPIVADKHLAGGFGVDGVGVIQQRRREQAGNVNDRPQQHNPNPTMPLRAGAGGKFVMARLACEVLGEFITSQRSDYK
jgi:hypothetical protein